jgi:hypothetical protein
LNIYIYDPNHPNTGFHIGYPLFGKEGLGEIYLLNSSIKSPFAKGGD